jgi:hypothetical protein
MGHFVTPLDLDNHESNGWPVCFKTDLNLQNYRDTVRSLAILQQYQGQYDRQEAQSKLKFAEMLMRQKRYDEALQLLDDSDDKASGYGHYYDLMWRIELARALIFLREGRWRDAILKGQMVLRYRRILVLSIWLLGKQLWQRLRAGTGLPR